MRYQNVKKYYYDPKYHGVDIDALYRDYNSRMQNAASLSQAFRLNASYLDSLHDTHTFFSPPARPYRLDSGYRLQMYGENCFITRVRPGTDAQSKVRPGDQVLGYNNYAVSRSAFWQMNFYFNDLAPQQVSNLDLRDPDGAEPKVTVDSKLRELKKRVDMTGQDGGYDRWDAIREPQNFDHVSRQRWVDVGDVMVWKMPEFEMEDHTVDHIFADARKHRTLILDLRGNPGGYTVTLERMIGNIFDHEVTIGDRVGRKALKPLVAKTRGHDAFSGKLIVLVDSISASCAELFSRVDSIGTSRYRDRGSNRRRRNGSPWFRRIPGSRREGLLQLLDHCSRPDHEGRQKPGTHRRDTRRDSPSDGPRLG